MLKISRGATFVAKRERIKKAKRESKKKKERKERDIGRKLQLSIALLELYYLAVCTSRLSNLVPVYLELFASVSPVQLQHEHYSDIPES